MRLASRTDYALRAALELASGPGTPLTTEELAARQAIPARYLGNILAELRRAEIVTARRGVEGGWTLGRPASEISLGQVIRAVGGALAQVAGSRPENLHYTGAAEHLREVWVALRAAERAILDGVTLADVVDHRLPPRLQHLVDDPASWH